MQLFLRLVLTVLLTLLELGQIGVLLGSLWLCGHTGKWVILHWTDGTFSFWLSSGLWAAWLFGSFLTAFFSGLIIRRPFKEMVQIGAWMWGGLFLAAAVYAWCVGPHSIGLVFARVGWSVLCIIFGIWTLLAVSFMAQKQGGIS